jgi:hypothetical protein
MNDESAASNSRGSPTQHHSEPSSADLQSEVAETRNDSPSSAIPIPRGPDDDIERGDDMAATLVNNEPVAYTPRQGWREVASRSFSAIAGSGTRAWRQASEDRNR